MCTLDLLTVNYNSQLTQTQTLWLPLHLNKVTFCYSVGTKSIVFYPPCSWKQKYKLK